MGQDCKRTDSSKNNLFSIMQAGVRENIYC